MDSRLLIADSGSTKTDWVLGSLHVKTQGINPIHQNDAEIAGILDNELLPRLRAANGGAWPVVAEIRFYGSGVRPDQEQRMVDILHKAFDKAVPGGPALRIAAHSDLLGAARSLCGQEEGVACILGTGANSCLYDGQRIVANTPPLGYILGDEGSGAVLGKRFLNALYKDGACARLREEFESAMCMRLSDVIDRVYRQPLANRWLASLSPFIHDHLAEPAVEGIVVDNFRDFVCRNIRPYQRPDLPLQAVGSIAYYYRDQLAQAVSEEGLKLGKILRSPLDIV